MPNVISIAVLRVPGPKGLRRTLSRLPKREGVTWDNDRVRKKKKRNKGHIRNKKEKTPKMASKELGDT